MNKSVFVALFFSFNALAGGQDRGGGTIVFGDNRWQIADVFMPPESFDPACTRIRLSKDMVKYVIGVKDLLGVYQRDSEQMLWASWFEESILHPSVRYCYVEKLPCEDDILDIPGIPGERMLGCTKGKVTYLLKYEYEKLDFNGQVLALLHERAHTFLEGHEKIVPFIRGVSFLIDLKKEQEGGIYRILNDREQAVLGELKEVIDNYGPGEVWPNGGGLVESGGIHISPSTLISLGSKVSIGPADISETRGEPFIENARIINSRVWLSGQFISHSTIRNSNVFASPIHDSKVTDSNISSSRLERGSDVSYCGLQNVKMSEESRCFRSSIKYEFTPLGHDDSPFVLEQRSEVADFKFEVGGGQFWKDRRDNVPGPRVTQSTRVSRLSLRNFQGIELIFDSPERPLDFSAKTCTQEKSRSKSSRNVVKQTEDIKKFTRCE